MAKPKIVILNGPPRCGKDTIGAALVGRLNCVTTCFKHDLYRATAKHFKVDLKEFIALASDGAKKDVLQNHLGMTPREALIHVSEDIYKPMYGKGYFGMLALERVEDQIDLDLDYIVFTDGGFVEEVAVFVDAGYEVEVIQLHGRGDFSNDSRRYITAAGAGCSVLWLEEGNVEKAVAEVIKFLSWRATAVTRSLTGKSE